MKDAKRKELLPCPFCGVVPESEVCDGTVYTRCETVGCLMRHTGSFLAADWNRRAALAQPAQGEVAPLTLSRPQIENFARLTGYSVEEAWGTFQLLLEAIQAQPPADTIAVPVAEYEAMKRDAERLLEENAQLTRDVNDQSLWIGELKIQAENYLWLRNRNLDAINKGGIFVGMTPDNVVLNGDDLDAAIELAKSTGEDV